MSTINYYNISDLNEEELEIARERFGANRVDHSLTLWNNQSSKYQRLVADSVSLKDVKSVVDLGSNVEGVNMLTEIDCWYDDYKTNNEQPKSDEKFADDLNTLRSFLSSESPIVDELEHDEVAEVINIYSQYEHGYRKGHQSHARVENKEYLKGGSKYKNGIGKYHTEKRGADDHTYKLTDKDISILNGDVEFDKIS